MKTASPSTHRLVFHGANAAAIRCRESEVCLVGPAGTGKSWAWLYKVHRAAIRYPGMRGLILRKTRESLTQSALVTFEDKILSPYWRDRIARNCQRRVRQSYQYPNGSEIVVGGLDRPSKVMSTEFDLIYPQEAIELTENDWESLSSRLRNGVMPYQQLGADTNPDAPTHWLKRRIDDGKTLGLESRHEDNPAITPEYLARLDALTGVRYLRLRRGIWAGAEGLWFDTFDPAVHVREDAEYDPALPVFLSLDPGVVTGGAFFQVRSAVEGEGESARPVHRVNVFADYLGENRTVEVNARSLLEVANAHCGGKVADRLCDPAGGARNPIGPTLLEVYARCGLPLRPWSAANPSVADSLARVEDLLAPVNGLPRLTVHPRCKHLVQAFLSYVRAKRSGQWVDIPADPQHPQEDLIDALRGGLHARLGGITGDLFIREPKRA